jgi:hypothetical protein
MLGRPIRKLAAMPIKRSFCEANTHCAFLLSYLISVKVTMSLILLQYSVLLLQRLPSVRASILGELILDYLVLLLVVAEYL